MEKVDTTTTDFIVEHQGLRTRARLEHGEGIDDFGEAIILAPGLGSPELAGMRGELAQLGHAAVSFEQPRILPFGWQLMDVAGLRAGVLEKVMDKTGSDYGLEKSVLAGHSLGVLDSLKVASRRGEQISSAEHMAGAGLNDADFCLNAMRLVQNANMEAARGNYARATESNINAWRNPAQMWMEGVYGNNTDARPLLEQQAKDGLDAGWLQFENDLIFPPSMVDRHLAGLAIRKRTTKPGETDHGCHSSPLDDPTGTARVLHEILSNRNQPDTPTSRSRTA